MTLDKMKQKIEFFLENTKTLKSIVDNYYQIFSWRFQTSSNKEKKNDVPYALDDIFSFVNQLHYAILYIIGEAYVIYGKDGKNLIFFLKEFTIKKIYKLLFKIYNNTVFFFFNFYFLIFNFF
jgi:hypothetical protein